ncbi:MAG: helix-turn-helix domain-containing protein [Paracoccaceae bacterium]
MNVKTKATRIPAYSLYGESAEFPDVLHCEPIADRAGLHEWHISPHRHINLHQIFLISSGHASMTIDGSSFSVEGMSIVTIPRHCVHGFKFEKRTKGIVLSIPSTEVAAIAGTDKALVEFFSAARIVPATDQLMNVLETINDEYHLASCARVSLLRGLATQLVCYLASSVATERQMINPVHEKITDFEKLAREHFAEGWKVSDYASALGLSATHLNRLSREVLGKSPKEYLHSLTIQEAKRLLAYTKIDVAAVGYRIGFDDPSYFSRVFMRQTGQSPRAFRNVYEIEQGLTFGPGNQTRYSPQQRGPA